ncbi:MAG: CBS domain-containing protein [Acidobacteriota bacterium]|nr:CBS domain-containing protein [Acidobacteriota bacterium]
MRELKVRDIMTKEVIWVPQDMSVTRATKLFVDEMISGAPVVDEEGAMVGVVSLRDFARNGAVTERLQADEEANKTFYQESWELPLSREEAERFHLETNTDLTVKEVMTPTLFYVDIDTPVAEVAEMMLKGRIHRVVVLEDDELSGMVTTMDMLKVICGVHV